MISSTARVEQSGKIAADVFEAVIRPSLGDHRPGVLVGPRHGVDAAVLDIGSAQVMVLTTDPLYVLPAYGWERATWFAIQIVASDAATSGLAPAYVTLDLNLPLEMSSGDFCELWSGIDQACRETGLAIVTGHTGRYEGCSFPMIGAATVLCTGGQADYVTPDMTRPGDAVIITKGAAIEATAHFGVCFRNRIEATFGTEVADEAAAHFSQLSVVQDARIAAGVGLRENGVTGMHDATERGVLGGLVEIAEAARVGLLVDEQSIPISRASHAVCDLFGMNPLTSSSEGTLLATCVPGKVGMILDRLHDEGIIARHIGEIRPPAMGARIVRGGREEALETPQEDPFWPAHRRALGATHS